MLTIEKLQVAVGSRVLIDNFSARWLKGQLVCILGANGTGKTSLLNHLAGVVPLAEGQVRFGSDDLAFMPASLRANKISSIAQHDTAELETIVYDRIAHGLFSRNKLSQLSRKDELTLVTKIARALGLEPLLPRPLYTLSGGQRKKVHIARCLVNDDADAYFLDEPDASLDIEARTQVFHLLKQIALSEKLVIASLHHLELAHAYADIVIDLGQTAPAHRIIGVSSPY